MSADNGIYILKSDGPEWRVAHAQAIENINYNRATGKTDPNHFNIGEVVRYFGESQVFLSEEEALLEARRMESGYPILEYGICDIHLPCKFPISKVNKYGEFIPLPCPWCGKDTKIYEEGSYVEGWVAFVECSNVLNCGARGPERRIEPRSSNEDSLRDRVIELWNKIVGK
jgi:hypothetical protein